MLLMDAIPALNMRGAFQIEQILTSRVSDFMLQVIHIWATTVCRSGYKVLNAALTIALLNGTLLIRNVPAESVVVICRYPVIGFRISTVAPTTTPPVGSVTVPSTVPLATDCARAFEVTNVNRNIREMTMTASREYVMGEFY